jgi:glycine C-acetyltransferase
MPLARLEKTLAHEITELEARGAAKGAEKVVTGVLAAEGDRGPRFLLEGHGDKAFVRMNSNSYLGMSLRPEVIAAEEEATRAFGAGPGAVRFISGTYSAHVGLERRLAAFHERPAGMIFSSAYAAVIGVITPLISGETAIISDELNHNCIINAIRMSRPGDKQIYGHLDVDGLDARLAAAAGHFARAVVITDGVFSMRGVHAPLQRIMDVARKWDDRFPDNVVVIVDDSHGVGALGQSGRGTEEACEARADVLVATLGKALGVNGGYVVSSERVVRYLREKAPMYIYSNPITPGEAAAAHKALDILDSGEGAALLSHLRAMTRRFREGLRAAGFETLDGEHPVVPLMVRDTARTRAIVRHLENQGILATGLGFPVVPKGDESIRFQVNASHTASDIDAVLAALADVPA